MGPRPRSCCSTSSSSSRASATRRCRACSRSAARPSAIEDVAAGRAVLRRRVDRRRRAATRVRWDDPRSAVGAARRRRGRARGDPRGRASCTATSRRRTSCWSRAPSPTSRRACSSISGSARRPARAARRRTWRPRRSPARSSRAAISTGSARRSSRLVPGRPPFEAATLGELVQHVVVTATARRRCRACPAPLADLVGAAAWRATPTRGRRSALAVLDELDQLAPAIAPGTARARAAEGRRAAGARDVARRRRR